MQLTNCVLDIIQTALKSKEAGHRGVFKSSQPMEWKGAGIIIRGWFNANMLSYWCRNSHCGDKPILQLSYLHYGISYTSKMASLDWIRAQDPYLSLPGLIDRKWS